MAPVLSDLKWPWRSFTSCRPFQVQSVEHLRSILPEFNWPHARVVPQWQLGFLSSSVKLHYYGRRTISEKLFEIGFGATMPLLSNYFDLLFYLPKDVVPGSKVKMRGHFCTQYLRPPQLSAPGLVPSETLSETLALRKILPQHADHSKCCQLSSTDDLSQFIIPCIHLCVNVS